MVYAQFFHESALDRTKLIPACGDRAVIILDARSPGYHAVWAKSECISRGFKAWQLNKGRSFTNSVPTSDIIEV
jgi:hypothetical protein